jgi:hypothetical protein
LPHLEVKKSDWTRPLNTTCMEHETIQAFCQIVKYKQTQTVIIRASWSKSTRINE